jgi:hypothetical protein
MPVCEDSFLLPRAPAFFGHPTGADEGKAGETGTRRVVYGRPVLHGEQDRRPGFYGSRIVSIHRVIVQKSGPEENEAILKVEVHFGEGCFLEITGDSRGAFLRFGRPELSANLDAMGRPGDIDQAVNILRLYMPRSRR